MILKTDLEARKRGLCETLHRIQLVTYGTLNPSVVIGDVALFHKEAQFAAFSRSNDDFKQWCLNSLTKGAAGAHAFLRKADEPPQILITFNDKRGHGSDPYTALSLRSDAWRKHWTKHDSDRRAGQLAAAFKQARDEAVNFQEANGYSSFTAKQVADALRGMRSERACGLDYWTPSNWLNLPVEARKDIASILSECETGLVWPHQVMQNAVALLGKSATDDRPISLTSLLYAVFVKIRKHVIADFDRAHATWWDSAVAGNSCLREGIRRRLKLIQQACQLKWNPVVLYMSLLVHMAPRVLRIGDLRGEWISPCNSILQGCGSSNSWARALLYNLLQDLHSRFPVQIGQQVDDINHHSQGTFFQALHRSVEATCMLDRGFKHPGADAFPRTSQLSSLLTLIYFGQFVVSCWNKD